MNCEVCQLKELEVEHFEVREVLRCILHTIVFHRALGLVRPKDVDLELFEITYVQCGDVEIEKKIDEKIEHFVSWVEKHPNKKSQICLSFYEVKSKQPSWFTNKTERLYWEQWYLNLNVTQHPKPHSGKSHHSKVVVDPGDSASEERNCRRAALEASLREVLFQIIKFVNEKKDHVPPISEGVIYFPYEITIPRVGSPACRWGDQGQGARSYLLCLLMQARDDKFIRFCFRNGHDQEDASDWASDHAQLIVRLGKLIHFQNLFGIKIVPLLAMKANEEGRVE